MAGGPSSDREKEQAGSPSRWIRLAAIDVRQPYYNLRSEGVCEDLAIAPTPETRARLAGHGFLWRGRRDGGDLLAPDSIATELDAFAKPDDAEAAPPVGLAKLLGGPPLMFTAAIVRAQFANVTEIPAGFDDGSRTLCISNRSGRAIEGAPGAPAAVAALAPQWDRAIDLEAAWESAAAIEGWVSTGDAAAFLDEARRQVRRARDGRLPFAILELHFAPGAAADAVEGGVYPVHLAGPAGGRVAPVRYRLALEPRSTRWRYVVGMRGGALEAASLAVCDAAADPIRFGEDKASLGALPGADATRCFVSDAPLPLAQRPHRSFYLEGRREGGRRAAARLIDPLPAPPADALVHRGTGGDAAAAVSEIYVYV